MISTERLRYYAFFGSLTDAQIKAIAMIADEEYHQSGEILFQKGMPAENLYFLEDGGVDLYYDINGAPSSEHKEGLPVGEINPGEPFSISALIEPHVLTATAQVSRPSRVIKMNAKALRALIRKDKRLAFVLTQKAATTMIARLHATRIQLVSILT